MVYVCVCVCVCKIYKVWAKDERHNVNKPLTIPIMKTI